MKRINLYIGILILFFIWNNCKEKDIQKAQEANLEFKPKGLILFVIGEAKLGEKPLQVGDELKENDSIQTGKKSVCDIQILGLDSEVMIRMKENSNFKLVGNLKNDVKNLRMKILSGKVLVNAQKLNSRDNIETITPTTVVGVRGTKFEVEVGKDTSSFISVYEGKVAAKVIIPEVESLPETLKEKSETLKKLDQYLTEKELIIESGNTSIITKKYADKVLKDTGIGEVLKSSDNKDLPDELNKKVSPEIFTEKLTKLKDQEIQAPVTKIPTKTFEEKVKEYEELITIEKVKLNDPNLKTEELKKRMKSPILMNRIEEIMGQSSEVIILKSGERLQGVIHRKNAGKIIEVFTPEGKKVFTEEDIGDITFPD